MKKFLFLLFSMSVLILTSCSSTRLITDMEKGVDFDKYSTFRVLDHLEDFPVGANQINRQRIVRAIRSEMFEFGYKEAVHPDLLVHWFVTVETKQGVDSYRNYYRKWRGSGMADIIVYDYNVGTLVIDILDNKEKKVVWHSKTTSIVTPYMNNVESRINRAVKDVFKRYLFETDAKVTPAVWQTH